MSLQIKGKLHLPVFKIQILNGLSGCKCPRIRYSLTVDSESRGGREPVGLLTLLGQLLVSKLGMKTMIDLENVKS